VRLVPLVVCLVLAGCSPVRSPSASPPKELIPAEWTVAEDTSANGEVTTASVQLPAAREIPGLDPNGESRLVLRCIDHRMQAFIETQLPAPAGPSAGVDSTGSRVTPIDLDSTPACD
jgi:uncharacterized protein YceK